MAEGAEAAARITAQGAAQAETAAAKMERKEKAETAAQ
jgi:hypothetical protein